MMLNYWFNTAFVKQMLAQQVYFIFNFANYDFEGFRDKNTLLYIEKVWAAYSARFNYPTNLLTQRTFIKVVISFSYFGDNLSPSPSTEIFEIRW